MTSVEKKVLIAGATGVVGRAVLDRFTARGDCSVVAISRRPPAATGAFEHLSLDLTDSVACRERIGSLRGVTHLIYAALYEKPGGLNDSWADAEQMRVNHLMLCNILDTLDECATDLRHACLLQGTKAYGVHVSATPIPVPFKEHWPRHDHPNFYWLQEDHVREKQIDRPWNWSILRPTQIVGDAVGSNLNSLLALAVYGSLRKAEGLPLSFPGDPGRVGTMIDAEMLARVIDWAGEAPSARNQIFNVGNGDVYSWEGVWETMADALAMPTGAPERIVISDYIDARQDLWADLVERHGLKSPKDVGALLGQSAQLADALTKVGHGIQPLTISSVTKLRQAGFHETMDTEEMIRKWLVRYQQQRLIPFRDAAR